MDLNDIAAKATDKAQIIVNPRDIERLLGALKITHDPWILVDLSDFPVPAVFESINILTDIGIVRVDDQAIKLTAKGKELVKNVHPVEDLSTKENEGRGISLEKFCDIEKKFLEIQKKRPAPAHRFDQGYVTPGSTLSRFALAYERGDVVGRDILILGDDDLLSVALGLSGLTNSITVIEIDERLTEFITNTANGEGFRVSVRAFDLRKPLPMEYRNRYDTFFTDPPETLPAADAFIGRGISALKSPGSAGYFGFTRREASLTKWHELQRMLLNYNVVFTDIIHNFNEYVNWGYEDDTRAWELSPVKVLPLTNWYRSSQYRIETLQGFSGNTKDYGTENIYEDHESSTT